MSDHCGLANAKSAKRSDGHFKARIGVIGLLTILGHVPASAGLQSPPTPDFDRLVQAIYYAEGGPKARKPFGILSVPCADYRGCRQVCLNTVRNTWRRWLKAGQPGEYLTFLGNRYAPPSAHPLNRYWVGNVRRLYDKIR